MKTIILCGGKGMRLHEETEFKPKPMVKIGDLPILIHIMNIYSHYGYNDFVLALGYRGDLIREYFLHLKRFANDLTYDASSGQIDYHSSAGDLPFRITFAETGEDTLSGERVLKASKYVEENDFMVTYGDGLSDVKIPDIINHYYKKRETFDISATITAAHPSSKYGQIIGDENDIIHTFDEKPVLNDYINAGFMVFHKDALSFLREGEMLETGLHRMVGSKKLSQFVHEGFWHSMDTMKDVKDLNELWKDNPKWKLE
ncbi:MAG: sugar phosphate nucleotidyltransferase [Candidatus Magasanikbacteria bacterium]